MAKLMNVQRVVAAGRAFFGRHWQRALIIRGRLRLSEDAFHLLLATLIGVMGAVTNLIYYSVSQLTRWLVLNQRGDVTEIAEGLEPWQRVLVPTLGGLAAGLILFLGLRLIANPGLTNLLEAVVAGDGRMRFRPALTNALSSLVSINTGASIGREGLLIQLTSTLASKLGVLANWPPYRLRLLVACGASAGIAAVYNAPIGGAVFSAQIVLGNFSMNLFAPLLVSSVIASVLSRTFFGVEHWFEAPEFEFTRLTELPWFLLLGLGSGLLGAMFLRTLRVVEGIFARLPVPLYARMGIAGLVVGLLAVVYPDVWGNGYATINKFLRAEQSMLFLFGLLAAKFVATSVTVGSGTVGGVFTPTLFLGAAFGSLFEGALHQADFALAIPTGCFAIVGMGSTLAATTHSPLLAMILLFELSLNYSLMPPLMLACAVSTLVGRRLHTESVYTEPLRRKGLELDRESPRVGAATERTVGDLMRPPVPPLRENTPFREMADRFLTSANNFLPVVNAEGRLLGIIALQDMKEYLNAGQELNSVIAFDLMRPAPVCLLPGQRLSDALPVLLGSELRNVPVVDSPLTFRLVGAVARAEALGLLSDAIHARSALA